MPAPTWMDEFLEEPQREDEAFVLDVLQSLPPRRSFRRVAVVLAAAAAGLLFVLVAGGVSDFSRHMSDATETAVALLISVI